MEGSYATHTSIKKLFFDHNVIINIHQYVIPYFLSNEIAKLVTRLKEIILELSKGVIPVIDMPITSTDEIRQMAQAIHQLTEV